ncbi:MAG: hypothetical protein IH983_04170 [Planctomycetes bacterium]|nr:hypothetical protein [Planctomycetota bacterium]
MAQRQRRRKYLDVYPPAPPWTVWLIRLLLFASLSFVAVVVYLQYPKPPTLSVYWAHLGFLVALLAIFWDLCLTHEARVHRARLRDYSEVRASIGEARSVVPRLTEPEERPEDFRVSKLYLLREVRRLQRLRHRGWTEYQVLTLHQMLVDYLNIDELQATARSTLADLEEYAKDTRYPYDRDQFSIWEGQINDAIKRLDGEQFDDPIKRDMAAEPLRARLRLLLHHVADYQANWAWGGGFLRSLIPFCAVAVLILLAMALLPVLFGLADGRIVLWGLLGIAGALTAVLLELHKTETIEVGDTEGRQVMVRTMIGAVLGLVAGILSYAIIGGGLLEGAVVPRLDSSSLRDICLMIVWAMAAGFGFERIFDRMRSATGGAG